MTTKATDQAKPATSAQAKTYFATRDFRDAGTTRSFKLGDELKDCTEGEIGNYEAAGLASTEQPADPKAADAA